VEALIEREADVNADGPLGTAANLAASKGLPSTLNPQPSTLNPQPPTLNPQPSPSTLNPQPSTLNPQPSGLVDILLALLDAGADAEMVSPETLNPTP